MEDIIRFVNVYTECFVEAKIVIFYTEILTRKVVLWCSFMSETKGFETSEKVHNSTFQVKISVYRT